MEFIEGSESGNVVLRDGKSHYIPFHIIFDIAADSQGDHFRWLERFGTITQRSAHFGCSSDKFHGHALIKILSTENGKLFASNGAISRQFFRQHGSKVCMQCQDFCHRVKMNRESNKCRVRRCGIGMKTIPIADEKHYNNVMKFIINHEADAKNEMDEEPPRCITHPRSLDSCVKCITRKIWDIDNEDYDKQDILSMIDAQKSQFTEYRGEKPAKRSRKADV